MRNLTAAILICLCFATCFALPQPRQKSAPNKDPVPAGRTISPLEITNICVQGDTVYLQGCPGAIHDSSRNVKGKPVLRDNENNELVIKNHKRRRFSLP